MFTGLIEGIGTIQRVEDAPGLRRIEVDVGDLAEGVALGDSVALDGCCLTVTRVAAGRLGFEAVRETLEHTALGDREVGQRVNVERAMRADARFGGHFVQGHVDGTGVVERLDRAGSDVRLRVGCPSGLADGIVPKGSIAIDGISLTVVEPDAGGFHVALIPHTLEATTLGLRQRGDRVNLELDLLGKYVRAHLAALSPHS